MYLLFVDLLYEELICGILIILLLIAGLFFIFLLGKNYLRKRNSIFKDLYQRSVDKVLEKDEEIEFKK
jgi:Na+/alanine symporter